MTLKDLNQLLGYLVIHLIIIVIQANVWSDAQRAKHLKEIVSDLSYNLCFVLALIQVDEIVTLIEQIEKVLPHDLVCPKVLICYAAYLMSRIASCHFNGEFI